MVYELDYLANFFILKHEIIEKGTNNMYVQAYEKLMNQNIRKWSTL